MTDRQTGLTTLPSRNFIDGWQQLNFYNIFVFPNIYCIPLSRVRLVRLQRISTYYEYFYIDINSNVSKFGYNEHWLLRTVSCTSFDLLLVRSGVFFWVEFWTTSIPILYYRHCCPGLDRVQWARVLLPDWNRGWWFPRSQGFLSTELRRTRLHLGWGRTGFHCWQRTSRFQKSMGAKEKATSLTDELIENPIKCSQWAVTKIKEKNLLSSSLSHLLSFNVNEP